MTKNLAVKVFILISIIGVGVIATFWNYENSTSTKTDNSSRIVINSQPITTKPTLASITNKSLYMGNVFFGRYIDDWAVQSASPELAKVSKYEAKATDKRDYSNPFSQLKTFERAKYNTWIAGLECPVTDRFVDSATQDDTLSFTCLPGYIPEAAKYFDVFTLANNHIDNQQAFGGLANTQRVLEANQIQYFGHYDNAVKSDICEVVALEASAKYSDSSIQKVKIPVAYCGFHNVFKLPLQDEIDVISQYAKYFPTVVMPHQGKEYVTQSDQLKQETYHKFVDAGADLVVGDHPHATQEMEYYKGKMIVYSLGNFIFDQQFNSTVTSAITLDTELSMTNSANGLETYLNIGKDCAKFKDSCLTRAKSENLQKPELEFKFDIVASDDSNKITKKASPEIQTKMEQITGIRNLKK
jgi:Bacterial capsule synthesis protein PGA_cap